MKNIKVALIGRPSSGKSTFINTITENKVSIVSSIPQSTRSLVKGIYTDKRGQIVFIDSPGLHIDERKFNKRLTKMAIRAIREADVVLYILDLCDSAGEEEIKTAFYATTSNKPVIVLLNKNDIAKEDNRKNARKFLEEKVKNATIFEGSALNDEGLDEVLIEIFKYAKEENIEFGGDVFTDAPLEFRIAEIIRESVFNNTRDEIPHSVCVITDEISQKDNTVVIRAVIMCERNTQKGILIGKNGSMIKKLRMESQKEIKNIFPRRKIKLELSIKLNPHWKRNEKILEKNGMI